LDISVYSRDIRAQSEKGSEIGPNLVCLAFSASGGFAPDPHRKHQFLVSNRPLSWLAVNFTAGLAFSQLKSQLSCSFCSSLAKNLGGWWLAKSAT